MTRALVGYAFSIDIRVLAREKSRTYSATLSGRHGAVSVYFDLTIPGMAIRWSQHGRDFNQAVSLVPTRPHFGGFRWWARCPKCDRRVAILYLYGSTDFACRTCRGLVHVTTRMPPRERLWAKERAIRFKLGHTPDEEGDYDEYEPLRRPPRMWNRTFERLREKDWSIKERLDDVFRDELRRKFGPKF